MHSTDATACEVEHDTMRDAAATRTHLQRRMQSQGATTAPKRNLASISRAKLLFRIAPRGRLRMHARIRHRGVRCAKMNGFFSGRKGNLKIFFQHKRHRYFLYIIQKWRDQLRSVGGKALIAASAKIMFR